MTNRERLLVKDLKNFMVSHTGWTPKGSNADYLRVYRGFCEREMTEAYTTRLYIKQGREYCRLLEVLEYYYADHRDA